jgi:hypothetical protein
LAPAHQQAVQHPVGAISRPDRIGPVEQALLAEIEFGRGGNRPADRAHGARHVLARGLGGLEVGVDRPVAALGVQQLHQRQQAGGLAGLARGVQQEIFLLLDQPEDLGQVPALKRRQAVVVLGADRTLGCEEAHGKSSCGIRSGWDSGGRFG